MLPAASRAVVASRRSRRVTRAACCRRVRVASRGAAFAMRIGRLVFGTRPWHHGLLGSASLGATLLAVATLRPFLIAASIALTTGLALGAIPLRAKAPRSTAIARGVVAPHREAYARTIAVCLYVNFRLAFAMGWLPTGAYRCVVAAFVAWLVPRRGFGNLNTWIFVVPIFLGIGADAAHQFSAAGSAWNENIDARLLLGVQTVVLCVAFGFTLAFRGYCDLVRLYAASAGALAGVVAVVAAYRRSAAVVAAAVALGIDRWCAANPPVAEDRPPPEHSARS